MRKDILYLKDKSGQEAGYAELVKRLIALDENMTGIENSIHQTKNQSVQDALNYGIKVNNRLAFLLAEGQMGDYPPTDQAKESFTVLSAELDQHLDRLDQLMVREMEGINKMVVEKGMPALKVPVRIGRP